MPMTRQTTTPELTMMLGGTGKDPLVAGELALPVTDYARDTAATGAWDA